MRWHRKLCAALHCQLYAPLMILISITITTTASTYQEGSQEEVGWSQVMKEGLGYLQGEGETGPGEDLLGTLLTVLWEEEVQVHEHQCLFTSFSNSVNSRWETSKLPLTSRWLSTTNSAKFPMIVQLCNKINNMWGFSYAEIIVLSSNIAKLIHKYSTILEIYPNKHKFTKLTCANAHFFSKHACLFY